MQQDPRRGDIISPRSRRCRFLNSSSRWMAVCELTATPPCTLNYQAHNCRWSGQRRRRCWIFRFLTPKPLPGAPRMPGMRGQGVPLQPPVAPDSDVARGAKGLCPRSQSHSVPSLSTSVSTSEKWAATWTVVCSSQAHGRGAPRWIKATARICMLGPLPS